ncbi:MAG: hypothetical protein ACYDHY_18105 [Acidiferrobacterales bacterium]
MGNEQNRLDFIEQRDGRDAAVVFALRTLRTYRKAVLAKRHSRRHHASLPEYRRSFIESYVAFKRYVATSSALKAPTGVSP